MVQESKQQPKEMMLLRQLIGEWSVGIAIQTPSGNVVSGCGEMSAVEVEGSGINSEINTHIEGYDDLYENNLWSYDEKTGNVHLYSVTSEGKTHEHEGKWVDDTILELHWRGTYEDQEQEEHIIAKWVSKDQLELRQTNYSNRKPLLTTDYVFKRKETSSTTQ
jgi:hypothetical protein